VPIRYSRLVILGIELKTGEAPAIAPGLFLFKAIPKGARQMNVQHRKTHGSSRQAHSFSAAEPRPVAADIELGTIKDSASVQRALSVVINAVAAGTLDPARARVLLYGLQIASTNAHRLASSSKTKEIAHPQKKTTDDSHTVTSPAVVVDASRRQEPQPVVINQIDQPEQKKPKDKDAEASTNDNGSTETETQAQPQPGTHAGHVRIYPSCFSPANEYSSGARDRLLAARQQAKLSSGIV
jgi:hypothetical protein